MPKVYNDFVNVTKLLEQHYKDMQDIEFTVENENFTYFRQDLAKELYGLT